MKFYNGQHEFYAGVDRHSNSLHVCVLDQQGKKRLHGKFRPSQKEMDNMHPLIVAGSSTTLEHRCAEPERE